jgi:hypothetical protein
VDKTEVSPVAISQGNDDVLEGAREKNKAWLDQWLNRFSTNINKERKDRAFDPHVGLTFFRNGCQG